MALSLMKSLSLCVIGMFVLQGCTAIGVATGVGATAGVAAVQEGGLKRAGRDALIQIEINDLWFRYNVDMFRKLDLTVKSGRVLITGVVQNPEHRVEAVRLAWQPKGVTQVINEINVADSDGLSGYARDAWITGRLRTALIFDRDVQSVNYSIDTVKRTIYLMGFAQDQAELNRVMETARTISDVQRVVSYVKLVGQDNEDVQASTITSQQYAKPPVEQERIDWGETPGDAQVVQQPGQEPVIILPQPDNYPNVQGRAPVLEPSSSSGSSAVDVIQSEDLLWTDRQ